ncbi:MBL fold metallo-hydrolase [Candidatus Bathyarchaeota archaeon]|nr:MBL fold metallo-hydrolase [Candidatus Bathyarchaeota archaeon]
METGQPNIFHHVSSPWAWDERGTDSLTNITVILGDSITLIDSGAADSPEKAIIPLIRKNNRNANEITDIILTHGHEDHISGILGLLEVSQPTIHIHELDEPKLETMFEKANMASSAIRTLKNNQVLELSGRELRVIHTPGHTGGSIVVLDQELGLAMSGDSIQGQGDGRPLIFYSSEAYEASLRNLLNESIETLMLGHPFPPFRKSVLTARDPIAFIKESLNAIIWSKRHLSGILEDLTEPFDLEEVIANVPELRESTILCILEELSKKGFLEVIKDSSKDRNLWIRKT